MIIFALYGCGADTAKRLSNSTTSNTPTTTTTADSIGIRYAYRDETTSTNPYVQIQGLIGDSDVNLSKVCTTSGADCTCEFYRNNSDDDPTGSVSVSLSSESNFITCKINSSTPSDYKFVRLKQVSGTKTTGIMNIQSTLGLSEILGTAHTRTKVRGIYSYTCTNFFLAGDGVSPLGVDCTRTPAWPLSIIRANYTYYLYQAPFNTSDSNRSTARGTQSAYNNTGIDGDTSGSICGITSVPRYQCGNDNGVAKYGLYAEQTSLFSMGVELTPNPLNVIPSGTTPTFGYAAPSDSLGNCPAGLIKLGQYMAIPSSVTSPSSLFDNDESKLNSILYEPIPYSSTSNYPTNFEVVHIPGTTNCTGAGVCTYPNGGSIVLQSLSYSSNPIVRPYACVIPGGLLR